MQGQRAVSSRLEKLSSKPQKRPSLLKKGKRLFSFASSHRNPSISKDRLIDKAHLYKGFSTGWTDFETVCIGKVVNQVTSDPENRLTCHLIYQYSPISSARKHTALTRNWPAFPADEQRRLPEPRRQWADRVVPAARAEPSTKHSLGP